MYINHSHHLAKAKLSTVANIYTHHPAHPATKNFLFFCSIAGNIANATKYPPISPPKCPYISTSDPNENNIEKNTKTPTVQHTCVLISP